MSKYTSRKPHKHLYNKTAWKRLAKAQKLREPLCRFCLERGVINDGSLDMTGARQSDPRRRFLVADHIKPHRGNLDLFLDPENLQTLCADHHDTTKQRLERRGYSEQRGPDGWPVDPEHPANR
ncbi:MAG: HNH endonuclease [Pseudomonadota bacterium]